MPIIWGQRPAPELRRGHLSRQERFEDEAFWEKMYPFMFPKQKFDDAEQEIGSVLELAGLESGDVLDLACGPGRQATALAKRGFCVTGVDLSLFLLRQAKDLARKEGVSIEWVQEDMRSFQRPETFDLAISLFTSFGYFDDRRDDVRGFFAACIRVSEKGPHLWWKWLA